MKIFQPKQFPRQLLTTLAYSQCDITLSNLYLTLGKVLVAELALKEIGTLISLRL